MWSVKDKITITDYVASEVVRGCKRKSIFQANAKADALVKYT